MVRTQRTMVRTQRTMVRTQRTMVRTQRTMVRTQRTMETPGSYRYWFLAEVLVLLIMSAQLLSDHNVHGNISSLWGIRVEAESFLMFNLEQISGPVPATIPL